MYTVLNMNEDKPTGVSQNITYLPMIRPPGFSQHSSR